MAGNETKETAGTEEQKQKRPSIKDLNEVVEGLKTKVNQVDSKAAELSEFNNSVLKRLEEVEKQEEVNRLLREDVLKDQTKKMAKRSRKPWIIGGLLTLAAAGGIAYAKRDKS